MSQAQNRFDNDRTVALHQDGLDRGWGFSTFDAVQGLQVTRWVLRPDYVAPPGQAISLGAPLGRQRDYESLAEWNAALAEEGHGTLWPATGGRYIVSQARAFDGIPSEDPAYYDALVPFPGPEQPRPSAAARESACGDERVLPLQMDTGEIFGRSMVTDEQALELYATQHQPFSSRFSHQREYWVLFPGYVSPREGSLLLSRAPGQVTSDPGLFLAHYKALSSAALQLKLVVAASTMYAE